MVGNTMDDVERCHICCEQLRLENVAIAILPCGHKFHAGCALQHSLLAPDGEPGFCSQCCESAVTECDSIATVEQDHSEQKPAKLLYDDTLHAAGLVKGAKYMMEWQGETYSVVEVAPQPFQGRADRVNLRLINMRIVASRQDLDHVSVSIDDAKSSLTPVDATNVNRVFETVCADANILRLFDADANSLVGRLVRRQARPKAKYAMLVEDGTREMLMVELNAANGKRRRATNEGAYVELTEERFVAAFHASKRAKRKRGVKKRSADDEEVVTIDAIEVEAPDGGVAWVDARIA